MIDDENFRRHWNGQLEQRLQPHGRNEDFYTRRLLDVRAEGGDEGPVKKELARVRRERGWCLAQWLKDVQAAQQQLPQTDNRKERSL